MRKNGISSTFDVLRWMCAAMVVLYHARQIMMPSWADLPSKTAAGRAFYAATAFGHEAVIVFFVISGFLVGGLTIASGRRFSLQDYATRRISRIYLVFVPALLLTAGLDVFGLTFFGNSTLYAQPAQIGSVYTPALDATSLTWSGFVGNLAMLYGVAVPKFGSNGPVWSLVNEWWYYYLFGACMVVATRSGIIRWVALAAGAAIAAILPTETLILGLPWAFGIVACLLARRVIWTPPILVSLAIALVTVVAAHAVRKASDADLLADLAVGAVVALAVLSIARRRQAPLPYHRTHQRWAEFSFSLYLTHYPVLVLGAAVWERSGVTLRGDLNTMTCAAYLSSIALSYAVAVAFWWAFERRTDAVRAALWRLGTAARGHASRYGIGAT